jgi:hypothetical protein
MERLWSFVAAMLPALAALLVAMPAVDLAYQLRAGAEILGGSGIPAVDTWTFTVAGTAWLDQQWGAQVLLRIVFDAFGWTGMAVLRAVLLALTFWLVFGAARRASGGTIPAAWLAILALGSFVVAAPALALRPQLFAIVLFAIVLAVLAGRSERPGRLWLIPLVAAAWANLHGSFPLVLVAVGLAALDDAARRRGPEALRLAVVGLVAAAATLVNPFGIDVWGYVVNLASNPTIAAQVSEWRPPSPLEGAGALFYGSLVVVGAVAAGALTLGRRPGRGAIPPAVIGPLVTLAAFAGLGVLTGRGLAWWALVAPIALATIVGVAQRRGLEGAGDASVVAPTWVPEALRPIPATERARPLNLVIVGVLVLAFVALLPSWRPVGPAGVPEGLLSHAPQGVAAELRELARPGRHTLVRVWNPQLWGSWLELAVPELQFALDSRLELFPASVWADAEIIATGADGWDGLLDRYAVTVVVVAPEQTALRTALEAAPGWVVRYTEAEGSIWGRSVVEASSGSGG